MIKFLGYLCTVIAVFAMTFAASTAGAHEGHVAASSVNPHSATHYATEPLHVGQICVAAAVLLCVSVIIWHGRQTRKTVVR